MSKRILSLFIAIIMTITLIPIYSAKAASVSIANIKIGDYVELGRYYDEPILWRCVDIDQNGPLMLSDKILTIKPFDAAGNHTYLDGTLQADYNNYRTNYGSNLWSTSNMRSWLNSDATAGNVKWLDGCPPTIDKVWNGSNAYANEKGFLAEGNFTTIEQTVIKSVTQKSLLSSIDVKLNKDGKEAHIYNSNIASVVQNYDTAYFENVTDKIFLLDVKQLNKVYQNGSTLGTDYWIGKPTQKCVQNSTYKDSELSSENNWYNWSGSPYTDSSNPYLGHYASPYGIVDYGYAIDYGLGARPAFYINLSSEIFKSGNGEKNTPYTSTTITVKTLPTKLKYLVGETIDITGLVVTKNYNDGITAPLILPVTVANISGFDSSSPITGQKVTITVEGKTATFDVDIVAKSLTGITVSTLPTKIQYLVGQQIDLTGLVITGNYNDGTTKPITVTETNISGFNSSSAVTKQLVTVTVDGKLADFTVDIIAISSIISNIKIGDYLELGRYYEEPILWRCVDIDEKGPLMLSDKILTIKPFDAAGNHTYLDGTLQADNIDGHRTNYGSNLWSTSNMRSWLNSDATGGNVKWLDGCPPTADKVWYGYNAYANEKGFLAEGNFTAIEQTVIKSVTQKSLLSAIDVKLNKDGKEEHMYNSDIAYVVQNYDNAYFENVTDKMFLLDVKQLNKVYQNLGTDYCTGKPTQKAVENSNFKYSELSSERNWYNWSRSPDADSSNPHVVRYAYFYGSVFNASAKSDEFGVRPAFYINLSSEIFKSGNGEKNTPYTYTTITFETLPKKLKYVVGEAIDLTDLVVTKNYNDGITAPIVLNVTETNISGFDSSLPINRQTVTITVEGKTATFDIEIVAKSLTGITISTPPANVQYLVGQPVDLTGLVVTGSYNDGTTKPLIITETNISGFDSSSAIKKQLVTITVDGKSASFTIDIIAKTYISDIKIGDYLELGRYYDEPILWRCVDIDDKGPLMLSDKILTIKPFDAMGNHKYLDGTDQADNNNYRTSLGSNLWSTSNMRSWLNSNATGGNVKWLDGCPPIEYKLWNGENAYANEKGFLAEGNFVIRHLKLQ